VNEETTPPNGAPGPTRRTVLVTAGAAAATVALARPSIVRAASEKSVKIGFIEDQSGNLSIYGIQKLHAAQLAVQEINDGYTLAGGPVGMGVLGSYGLYAPNPPTLTTSGGTLNVVSDGGTPSNKAVVTSDTDEILVSSGEKGLLGQPLQLISADGQSNNILWQQLARRMIQQDRVDVLFAGFASAEREAIRPIVDQHKQLYFYTTGRGPFLQDVCTGVVQWLIRSAFFISSARTPPSCCYARLG